MTTVRVRISMHQPQDASTSSKPSTMSHSQPVMKNHWSSLYLARVTQATTEVVAIGWLVVTSPSHHINWRVHRLLVRGEPDVEEPK